MVRASLDSKASGASKASAAKSMAKGSEAASKVAGQSEASQPTQSKTFVEQLGFSAPGLKDQMLAQTPSDPIVEDYIDQDATFIKSQEGYPSFFRTMQDKLSQVSFSNGTSLYKSRPFGVLDFFDSLMLLPKIHACIL